MIESSEASKYLSSENFKKPAEALAAAYFRYHEAVKVLLLYQAQIQTKLEHLGIFANNFASKISDFNAALTLITSTQSSMDISCTETIKDEVYGTDH